MKAPIITIASMLLIAGSVSAEDKYPLTMTAVFTAGKIDNLHKADEMYHSGDYDCTRGDEHNAPECHTVLEWAELDAISGTPDKVVFSLADGSQVGVHSRTIHKIPGFIECSPSTQVVFCNLYFEFLTRQNVNVTRQTQYGQSEVLSSQEFAAAADARHRQLFGNGNTMTLSFRYKLKGKPNTGFQRIELDKTSCVEDHGTNHCSGVLEVLNARGNGYIVGAKVEAQPTRSVSDANGAVMPVVRQNREGSGTSPATTSQTAMQSVRQNSDAAKTSPAAAAAMANAGHVSSPQELAQLVANGQASRCAVVTTPPGAEVFVDGNKGGVSPLVFVLLKQGDTPRTITIKMAGYKTVEKTFVPDGRTIPVSVTLEKVQ